VKALGSVGAWGNIIGHGPQQDWSTTRKPAIWFQPGTTRLVPASGATTNSNPHFYGPALKVGRYYHVALNHCRNGKFSMYVNGKRTNTMQAGTPADHKGPFWGAEPFHGVANAKVRAVYWRNRCSSGRKISSIYRAGRKGQVSSVGYSRGGRWATIRKYYSPRQNRPIHAGKGRKFGSATGRGYSIALWFKPTGRVANWGSILSRGTTYHKGRRPGFWLSPNSYRLMTASSSVNNWNAGNHVAGLRPLHWNHIVLTHCKNGVSALYVNGKRRSQSNIGQPVRSRGPFFGGDPWHSSAKGKVFNAQYLNRCAAPRRVRRYYRKSRGHLRKALARIRRHRSGVRWVPIKQFYRPRGNRQLHNGKSLGFRNGRGFAIAFWVKPHHPIPGWGNIVSRGKHYHTGRSPAAYFYPNSLQLGIASSSETNWNPWIAGPTLKAAKWAHVAISHCPGGKLSLFVNGRRRQTVNAGVPVKRRGPIMGSDAWHSAANAKVIDLRYLPVCANTRRISRLVRLTRSSVRVIERRHRQRGSWKMIKRRYSPRQNRKLTRSKDARFLFKRGGAYSVSFWVKPRKRQAGWANIFARGNDYNHGRQPAAWFYPGSYQLGVASASTRDGNAWIAGPTLAKKKWSHVVISHCQSGRLSVYVNGQLKGRRNGDIPTGGGGRFWGSDPWHAAAKAKVRQLKYNSVCVSSRRAKAMYKKHFSVSHRLASLKRAKWRRAQEKTKWRLIAKKYTPKKNTIVNKHGKSFGFARGRGYAVSLWVKPTGKPRRQWANILARGKDYKHGRHPGIYFHPGTTKVGIASSSIGNWNTWLNGPVLRKHEWHNIVINHCHKGRVSLWVNGKRVSSSRSHVPVTGLHKWYGSDPWHSSANAKVAAAKYLPLCTTGRRIRREFLKTLVRKMPWRLISKYYRPRQGRAINKGSRKAGFGFAAGAGYALSMWVKARGPVAGWGNIIARGNQYHTGRQPGVWFYPGTLQLGAASSAKGNWNPWIAGPHVAVRRWTHVVLSHCANGRFSLYVDGKRAGKARTARPVTSGGQFWGSDPWHGAANAEVANARYLPTCISKRRASRLYREQRSDLKHKSLNGRRHRRRWAKLMKLWKRKYHWKRIALAYQPRQNRKLVSNGKRLRYAVGKGYAVAFWVKPTGVVAGWSNLLHRGDTDQTRGPGVWFWPGSTRLHLVSSSTNNWNLNLNPETHLPMNQWTHVALSHCHNGRYSVYINGKLVGRVHNQEPTATPTPLYGSDPWYPAAASIVYDLRYLPVCASTDRIESLYGSTVHRLPATNQDILGFEGPVLFSCQDYWETKDSCPVETHERVETNKDHMCHPLRSNCQFKCCKPKKITCREYYGASGCPAGFMNNNQLTRACVALPWGGNSCDRQCCDYVQPGQGKCMYWGDPHLISFDNKRYDCTTPGEYQMYKSEAKDEEVHNEQVKMPGQRFQHIPPLNVGMAIRDQSSVFSLFEEPPQWEHFSLTLRFNGKLIPFPHKKIAYGNFILNPIGSLPPARASPSHHAYANAGISIVNVRTGLHVNVHFRQVGYGFRYLDISVNFADPENKNKPTVGMCGTWDGNADNDLLDSKGGRCTPADSNQCCLTWRIARHESLFNKPEAPKNFYGLCAPARTCPTGWKDVGLAGAILRDVDYGLNPFAPGGQFNSEWKWTHPRMCCATGSHSRLEHLTVYEKDCGAGTADKGLAGIIMANNVFRANPFLNGGAFNSGWTWTHPKNCKVRSHTQVVNNPSIFCLLGKHGKCPNDWHDHGFVGLLTHKNDAKHMPFNRGGGFNHGWDWTHPKLCCTSGGSKFGYGLYEKHPGKDITGKTLEKRVGTAAQCATMCMGMDECAGFTRNSMYADFERANCRFKSVGTPNTDNAAKNTYGVERSITAEKACGTSQKLANAVAQCKDKVKGSMYKQCLIEFCAGASIGSIAGEINTIKTGHEK